MPWCSITPSIHAGASGTALGSTRMILDTPDSQLVEAAPNGATKLPQRAALLADVRARKYPPGAVIVFIHTGGVPAIFAEPEKVLELG